MLWQELSKYRLGLRKGQVELVDHDEKWAEAFVVLKDRLQNILPPKVCEFFHIGSTSIPAICAKPVLDVLGVVRSLEIFDTFRLQIEDMGFTWKGEFGIAGRRYSPLYDDSGLVAFVHMHVFQRGSCEVESHLRFRDILRSDPIEAQQYDSLKRSLATKFRDSREIYTKSKNDFIQRVSKSGLRS